MQILDQRAAGAVEAERLGKILSDRLQRGPEPRPLHRAALQRRLNHEPHHVGRNRKSDALRSAAARKDGGVDADEMAVHIDERTAGIAGIDGGVGLNEELVVGDADLRAGERRDNAARHRLPHAERIADGEHEVADFEAVGVAEFDGREADAGGAEAEHDEIAPLVLEDDLGRELAPVGQGHGDLSVAASLNDVVVGDRKPFRAHQHARAERVLDTLARNAEIVAEQAAEERIVGKRRNHLLHLAADIDVDDGRRRALHDGCEGLLHRNHALRRDALRFGERGESRQRRATPRRSARSCAQSRKTCSWLCLTALLGHINASWP